MSNRESSNLVPRSFFGESDPLKDFFSSPLGLTRAFRDAPSSRVWAPVMDIVEDANGYTVTVELAGAKKSDVTIECHEGLLTIKGEKKSEREEEDEHRHYSERVFGSFSRSIRLPSDASEDIRASFKDGVLTIAIPKAEERKPRAVVIDG